LCVSLNDISQQEHENEQEEFELQQKLQQQQRHRSITPTNNKINMKGCETNQQRHHSQQAYHYNTINNSYLPHQQQKLKQKYRSTSSSVMNNYRQSSASPTHCQHIGTPPLKPRINTVEQQQELENMINDLEEENLYLMEEYTRLQNQLSSVNDHNNIYNRSPTNVLSTNSEYLINTPIVDTSKSSTTTTTTTTTTAISPIPSTLGDQSSKITIPLTKNLIGTTKTVMYRDEKPDTLNYAYYPGGVGGTSTSGLSNNPYYSPLTTATSQRSSQNNGNVYSKLPTIFTTVSNDSLTNKLYLNSNSMNKESQMIAEARILRQHEDRLEARMKILENHNKLLDNQLKQLRTLLNSVSFS
jgi:hypothetical protein